MAERGGGGRGSRPKPTKLPIEEYLDFIHSHKQLDLTVDHLNQIIDMHGFNKIYKTHKRILIEVVKSLELMDPSRSTLQDDGVSSDAFLSLNDVVNDLNKLEWQECCITSLQTLNSVNIHNHHHQQYVGESLNSGGGGASAGTSIVSAASEKPKRLRRKIRKLAQIGGGKDSVSAGLSFDGLETASCSSPAVNMMSWGPRKKRTVNYVDSSGNGDGGVANFGVGVAASVAATGGVPPQAEPPALESASPIIVLDA